MYVGATRGFKAEGCAGGLLVGMCCGNGDGDGPLMALGWAGCAASIRDGYVGQRIKVEIPCKVDDDDRLCACLILLVLRY